MNKWDNKANTGYLMCLVQVFEKMKQTYGRTNFLSIPVQTVELSRLLFIVGKLQDMMHIEMSKFNIERIVKQNRRSFTNCSLNSATSLC